MTSVTPLVSIAEIVTLVGGRYDGPSDCVITGVTSLSDADAGQLSFLGNPKYASQLEAMIPASSA
jgi:UDP-3-O-[3-hydroxymyristoyl] glucosamine N-acyltransferase